MQDFLEARKSRILFFKKDIRKKKKSVGKVNIPEGLFSKCEKCSELIFNDDLKRNNKVCPKCNFHFNINARERINLICDKNSFVEFFTDLRPVNPLDFPEYEEKLKKNEKETGETDAFVCGEARISNNKVAFGVLDSCFFMGSMGCVVGEKITRLIEYATQNSLPLIIFSASGGARMQEGIFSLMQMVKTSAALKRHSNAKLLYISIMTNPTTGGVAASFASLGDINIAERGALIGFAGPRVIKQTINQSLPEGFQSADFQLKKGFVDLILDRNELKPTISKLLSLHEGGQV
ncbi:MAG: acetyl-CoA carboxylase, carboxyltransferase subunit beta [Clostridia bacterium]|jgi:acetyl-CoA carboxylase carboxyl transferase subunit beta|nr:acetyl-CoA carboxylase, carboxyltransferase subunit beta [Clostridia bacterium]MDD3232416.1 acetyl-CoA carboxylase, carboxyltransferase subunit beta [Clostridia bacterium]MDD3862339.1 acetyl-CoA carboxylase, carboxyltransferase subunit beta [Clostridia bacterium]MDD4408901.1 acetyl-CoA carboxylase, carboxyltransferase subunit beta [Clostridia bacterium]